MAFVLKRTLALSALLALVCLLLAWLTHQSTLREVRDRLTGEASLLAEHAARSLEGIDLTLNALVQIIEADWRNGEPPNPGYHDMLRKRVQDLPQVTGIVIVDRDGNMVADQITLQPRDVFLGDRRYFRVHAEGRVPEGRFLGDPVRGRMTGKSFFSASYALKNPEGGFGGVIAATFDPFYYRRYYERRDPGGVRHDVALIDGDGLVMASSGDFVAAVEVPAAERAPGATVRPALTPGGVIRFAQPGTGEAHIAALVGVPLFPFYAYVGLPEREALSSWRYLALGLAVVWLLVTLGSAAAFAGIWRREAERQNAFTAMREASREARAALERAEAASAAKSRFLAHMSHELRTPLNAILGFSEVVRDGVFGSNLEQDREYAGLIHKSGRHLLQIINDILDLSRIEAGKMTIRRGFVEVSELCEAAALLCSGDFDDVGARLDIEVPEGCPRLYADEKAAKQMLVNLLSNAAKFASVGDRIELGVEALPDGGLALRVADRGPGIPAERLATVFEPFEQSAAETTIEGQGTGLGLPLVKSLIELHGGRIEIDSEEGRGTRVTLTFPPPPGDAMQPPEPEVEEPRQASAAGG